MSRLALIKKYARVWNTAPWVERLMFRQQEMRYMWNSNHAYDGGAFYRRFGRWTRACVPPTKDGNLWNSYHPEHEKRDQEECRLFELTKNISRYGVGRIVYNKYERTHGSDNLDLLTTEQPGPKYPDTYWIITRAWNDWKAPESDLITDENHKGNFGYCYGLVFHRGVTDGLEREMVDMNEKGWYIVPRHSESELLEYAWPEEPLLESVREVDFPPVLAARERRSYTERYGETKSPKLVFKKFTA